MSVLVPGDHRLPLALASHKPLLPTDLEAVLDASADDFTLFQGGRMLMTGVTGFIGSWLLETLLHADARMRLGLHVEVLVRDPGRLAPHLREEQRIKALVGDVRTFAALGQFDAVVHAAGSSNTPPGSRDAEPSTMFATIVEGTQRALEAAEQSGGIPFLFTSSGAVYGFRPEHSVPVEETFRPSPNDTGWQSAYVDGKRMAEALCNAAAIAGGPACRTARCFSFTGPRLALDAHFAAGNFIGDVLGGRPVKVRGTGRTVRSYLYAADLVIWLWRILARGDAARSYNVGSEEAVSIEDLGRRVAGLVDPEYPVEIIGCIDDESLGKDSHYVPSTARARRELGLEQTISLEVGLQRMLEWCQMSGGTSR